MKAKEKLLFATAGLLTFVCVGWLSADAADAASASEQRTLLPALQRSGVQPLSPFASVLLLPGVHKNP